MNQSLNPFVRQASKDLEMIRAQIYKDQAEKTNELKRKREKEIENIRMNIEAWKCKTDESLAQKVEKEFKKNIERTISQTVLQKSSSNQNPIGLIEDLRENLRLRNVIGRKSTAGIQQIDEQNNNLQSSWFIPNRNNSSSAGLSRPQSASNENYRKRRISQTDLQTSSSLSLSSCKHNVPISNQNPIGLIEDLRENIRQLREENLSLRKVIVGKSTAGIQQIDEQNNYLQSCWFIPNRNNSSSAGLSRPQSASNKSYRKRYYSLMQRSGSFKNHF